MADLLIFLSYVVQTAGYMGIIWAFWLMLKIA